MKEVLWRALKETASRKAWNYVGGSASTIIAVLLIAKNFFGKEPTTSVFWGLLGLLALYLCRFILLLLKNGYKYWIEKNKESIYGNALLILKEISVSIYRLKSNTPIPDDHFILTMGIVCQQIKLIFDKKTKCNCAVSIKVVYGDEVVTANSTLLNLCRDKSSTDRDTETYKKTPHRIFSNTCYNIIFDRLTHGGESAYYINNDIATSKDYRNTSKDCYKNGELPYKSELVVPIMPPTESGKTPKEDEKLRMVGFLCIDCNGKDAFDNKYDVAVVEDIAGKLFDIIDSHTLQQRSSMAKPIMANGN